MAPSSSAFLCLTFWALLISPAVSLTCSSQNFTNNQVYSSCVDLPSLSYLHFSYDSSNTTLSIAFIATPAKSGGWIAWAINPKTAGMAGSQSLVAYINSTTGVAEVHTYDISSYSSIVPKGLSFEVWDKMAESKSDGSLAIYAKIKVPADLAAKWTINQVWQIGPGVEAGGILDKHLFDAANLQSKGSLDLKNGQTSSGSGGDTTRKKKNIHGILNAVSWGILFPLGAMIARYIRTFESADPAWFYLHVFCQTSGYAIGVAGWGTGLKLGSESAGITYSCHRNIGIALFVLATVQIFALFLRPKKDHKYRFYWNIYHHSFGYAILILGIINVFKGFNILRPEHKWRSAYMIVIIALGGISLLLEAITWGVVLKRKSRKSTKPYDGYNNGQGRQQPLAM
ncbi:hypothetical protein REPUB_Repub17cG0051800 [Reevesia pubescens]